MHPEISKFPREQFYKKEGALLDLENPKPIDQLRQWNYTRYSKRSIWIDVNQRTKLDKIEEKKEEKKFGNFNINEANKLIFELEEFLKHANDYKQPEGKDWTVACLTFYQGQEKKIRERLQNLTGKENANSNFNLEIGNVIEFHNNEKLTIKNKINIKLHTVDKFQGHEADIVFLSMVQTHRDGFMDNPNRLNVAITRAKFQLIIIGDYNYFAQKSRSEDLKQLALNTKVQQL